MYRGIEAGYYYRRFMNYKIRTIPQYEAYNLIAVISVTYNRNNKGQNLKNKNKR